MNICKYILSLYAKLLSILQRPLSSMEVPPCSKLSRFATAILNIKNINMIMKKYAQICGVCISSDIIFDDDDVDDDRSLVTYHLYYKYEEYSIVTIVTDNMQAKKNG